LANPSVKQEYPDVMPTDCTLFMPGGYKKTILHDEFHWLDVPERTEYKLGVTVYRCLHGRAPRYLADHLIPASDVAPRRRRLRSAKLNSLTVEVCASLSTQHVRLSGFYYAVR